MGWVGSRVHKFTWQWVGLGWVDENRPTDNSERADERFGDPPPRWIQEPSVVRDRDGRPPRGPSGSALLLCV